MTYFLKKPMKKLIFSLILSMSVNICYGGSLIEVEEKNLQEIVTGDKREKIVMFFATWCSYCKPIVMSKDLPRDKITFISIDSDKEAIDKMTKEMSYNVYYVRPSNDMKNLITLSKSFGINFPTVDYEGEVSITLPYIFLIDSNGKVVQDAIAPEDIHKYLK
jgi:thiol-disulfide isomerase/thioredoxin